MGSSGHYIPTSPAEPARLAFPLPVHQRLAKWSPAQTQQLTDPALLYARALLSAAVYGGVFAGPKTDVSALTDERVLHRVHTVLRDVQDIAERAWLEADFHALLTQPLESPADRRHRKKTVLGAFTRRGSPYGRHTRRLVHTLLLMDQLVLLPDIYLALAEDVAAIEQVLQPGRTDLDHRTAATP